MYTRLKQIWRGNDVLQLTFLGRSLAKLFSIFMRLGENQVESSVVVESISALLLSRLIKALSHSFTLRSQAAFLLLQIGDFV